MVLAQSAIGIVANCLVNLDTSYFLAFLTDKTHIVCFSEQFSPPCFPQLMVIGSFNVPFSTFWSFKHFWMSFKFIYQLWISSQRLVSTLHWTLRDSNVEFLSIAKLFGGRLEWYIGIKTYLDSVYEFPLMAIYEKPISKWSCFLHHISKRSRTINELEGTDLYFQYYKLYLQ